VLIKTSSKNTIQETQLFMLN